MFCCFTEANLEIHGHICSLHGELTKVKKQQTIKNRYGELITNISQVAEIKERKRQTTNERFGVDWPMQAQQVRQKSAHTVLMKYGVSNVFSHPSTVEKIREKVHKPCEKLNGLTPFEHGLLKLKKTCQEKFGCDYYFQSEQFKQRSRETCLDRYGADNIRKTIWFHEKMIERGIRYSINELNERQIYYARVRRFTMKTLKKYESTILAGKSVVNHIDHIYSIYAGFKAGISPKIIGSIVNLQLLSADVNRIKKSDCWMSVDELLLKFYQLNSEDQYILFNNDGLFTNRQEGKELLSFRPIFTEPVLEFPRMSDL